MFLDGAGYSVLLKIILLYEVCPILRDENNYGELDVGHKGGL